MRACLCVGGGGGEVRGGGGGMEWDYPDIYGHEYSEYYMNVFPFRYISLKHANVCFVEVKGKCMGNFILVEFEITGF